MAGRFRKRYRRRRFARKSYRSNRFSMRKAMRIRASRPEIKYWNDNVDVVLAANTFAKLELTPEQLAQGVSNNQRIGVSVKFRNLKFECNCFPQSSPQTSNATLYNFPVRVCIVKRRITDDTDWDAYIADALNNNRFFQGNFAKVLYDKTNMLYNPFRTNAGAVQSSFRIAKNIKIPQNVAYSTSGDMSDYKDMYYALFHNYAPQNMTLVFHTRTRVSYIDN